ncbi:ribosome maturation factor RimP [Fulvivirga sedimenti]|uniref:Ribosome maturation factor RimP n=1 Tax=Fulvivirga sedimenti TaxID=2879465 RepID=A0A9X1HYZ0_9BACT|nr:ribosome maturation factor RimP [Fulvivirga sedimenti]MCA6079019.1 ribosome maturation factor RimP [Fulvivirga sedimenti]
MMSVDQKIRELCESLLSDASHFIVEVDVSSSGSRSKVKVLLDGDNGVTIDDCASMSRQLGSILEEQEVLDGAYTLEVSSPGVDYPLSSERQYRKNIGRNLKIRRSDSKEIKGKLISAGKDGIEISYTSGKGKDKKEVQEEIPYKEIEKAIVQISFK